jgi:hypothetical protein
VNFWGKLKLRILSLSLGHNCSGPVSPLVSKWKAALSDTEVAAFSAFVLSMICKREYQSGLCAETMGCLSACCNQACRLYVTRECGCLGDSEATSSRATRHTVKPLGIAYDRVRRLAETAFYSDIQHSSTKALICRYLLHSMLGDVI